VTTDAGAPSSEDKLIERERELAGVAAALARARHGEGSICVFEGDPGVGKSALLEAAGALCGAEGLQVLIATCRPLERGFPYGVALQLFEQRMTQASPGERRGLLSGPAGLAAPLLLGDPDFEESDERRGLLVDHGLYWLCSKLAEKSPLAIVVDDGQEADPVTLRFFAYLAHRISDLPVVLILAWRAADSVTLRELAANPAATTFQLRPLTPAGVSRLLRESLGDPDAGFAKACHDATGGNPFLLQELITELGARGIEPTSMAAVDVASIAPRSVTDAALTRLRGIGDGALELARAVAVLGGSTDVRRAAELAQIPLPEAAEAAHSLIEAAVLVPAQTLSFVHPIVQAVVYQERSGPQRAEAHRRVAELLQREQAAGEEVAAHLLRAAAAGDRWVVDVLLAEAAQATREGVPDSAVPLLERAQREPPEPDQRAAVVLALGRAEALVASPQAVSRPEAGARADGRSAREGLGRAGGCAAPVQPGATRRGAVDDGEEVLAHTQGLPSVLRRRLEAGVAASRRVLGRRSRMKIDVPEDAQETTVDRFLPAQLAYEAALEGRPVDEVKALATRALGGGALLEEETADGIGFYLAVHALTIAEDFNAAELALGAALEDARLRGSVLGYANASCYRGLAILSHGRLEEGAADLENCLAGQRYGWALALPGAHAALAECHIERGDLAAAERTLNLGEETGPGSEALGRWRPSGRARASAAGHRPVPGGVGRSAGGRAATGALRRHEPCRLSVALAGCRRDGGSGRSSRGDPPR